MHKTLFTLLGAIFVLFVFAVTAGAEPLLPEGLVIEDTYKHGFGQSVGRILLLQGDVIVIHQNELVGYRAKKGTPVYKMDTVVSLKRGRCLIRMNDRSRLTLASRTKITLNRSLYKPAKKERSSYFKMALGKARFWVTKLTEAKRSEFRIKAATAVVGIRGSDFLIEIIEEQPPRYSHALDRLTASLATDLALNGDAPPADLGVRITTLDEHTVLDATSVVDPNVQVQLDGLQQVTFAPDAMPSDVVDIDPADASDIMGDMPVDTEGFQQLPMQPAVTGQQPAGQADGAPGEDEGEGAGEEGGEEGAAAEGEGEGAAAEGEGEGAAAEGGEEGAAAEGGGEGAAAEGEAQGFAAEGGEEGAAADAGDEGAGAAPAEEAGAGEEPGTEPAGEPLAEEPGDAGEPATAPTPEPEPDIRGLPGTPEPDAPEPEIFVDDSLLEEPEALGEEVEVPAPIEPEVDDIVNQEGVESAQEAQQEIEQEIYEETVAEELPDFPGTPSNYPPPDK